MRLINPNDMVCALRGGRVRTWEVFIYASMYILGWVLLALTFVPAFPALYTPFTSTRVQVIEMVVVCVLLVGEIAFAYRINRAGDGIDFWRRYVSLQGALFLPTALIAFAVGFISFFFSVQADGVVAPLAPLGLGDVLVSSVMSMLLIVWLLYLMHRVSHPPVPERRVR